MTFMQNSDLLDRSQKFLWLLLCLHQCICIMYLYIQLQRHRVWVLSTKNSYWFYQKKTKALIEILSGYYVGVSRLRFQIMSQNTRFKYYLIYTTLNKEKILKLCFSQNLNPKITFHSVLSINQTNIKKT